MVRILARSHMNASVTSATETQRIHRILQLLRSSLPPRRSFLSWDSPLQLLVATILSAQSTDRKVNQVTPALFARYPTAEAFSHAAEEELAEQIRSIGLYRAKARHIIASCRMLCERFGGAVPCEMAQLVQLPGVARKTANIVLADGFGIAAGIAVDTHVKRLAGRLGLSSQTNPDKIEQDLLQCFAPADWRDINYLFIAHGRATCTARTPRCAACVLRDLCPNADTNN